MLEVRTGVNFLVRKLNAELARWVDLAYIYYYSASEWCISIYGMAWHGPYCTQGAYVYESHARVKVGQGHNRHTQTG